MSLFKLLQTVVLCFMAIEAQASVPKPRNIYNLQVQFKNYNFQANKTLTQLTFSDGFIRRKIKIEKCNSKVITEFFKTYESKKSEYTPLPKSILKDQGVSLMDGVKDLQINPKSPFGQWLRKLPSESNLLFVKSEYLCKQKKKTQ